MQVSKISKEYFHLVPDSHFIKSWTQVRGYNSLHIFYNHKSLNFSAILEDSAGYKVINDTDHGSTAVKVSLLDCKEGRDKLQSLQNTSNSSPLLLNFIEFLKREIRYPVLQESAGYCGIQLNCGGLLGGGAKVSRPMSAVPNLTEKHISEDKEDYRQIHKFLVERYKIKETSNGVSNDQKFVKILAKEICKVLPQEKSLNILNHISENIDIYEEELCANAVLKLLWKSKKDGNPSLTDYTRNFDSSELSIQLLRKGYFAHQQNAKHGIEHLITKKVLGKLAREIKPLVSRLEKMDRGKAKGQPGDGLEAYFALLEKKDQATLLLRNIPKTRLKKVLAEMKESLGVTSNKEEDLILELCFSSAYDEISKKAIMKSRTVSPSRLQPSRSSSPLQMRNSILSQGNPPPSGQDSPVKTSELDPNRQNSSLLAPSPDVSPTKKDDKSGSLSKVAPLPLEKGRESTIKLQNVSDLDKSQLTESKADNKGRSSVISIRKVEEDNKKTLPKQLSYLDKIRLSVLNELNLFTHELNTLVELHNMLKLDQDIAEASTAKENPNDKNPKLNDIKALLLSMVKGYRENESTLESTELSSLMPLAFVQDKDIFRSFLDAFLIDLRSDILLDPKKIRMMSLIIISALKNEDFHEYLKVDDLIQCLKTLKPKIEDLSITSENVNLQEVMNSLNDILFLMGFIGAKGIKGEYPELVADLTKHMQSHGLEKTFNMLTGKAKDPSLEIKRNYALESFKRIEGTSFEEWKQNFETLLQVGEIAMGIGKGIFMSDLGSMTDALLQIKDLLVQAYANRPKTWYDDANNLRFLAHEPIEKIIAEMFPEKPKSFNKNYTFFAVEFMLSIIVQPERRFREKKVAVQALWFLANGFDYKQQAGHSYPVKSIMFKSDRDIISYVKKSLLNIGQNADINLNIHIRKLVENPVRVDYTDLNKDEPFALVGPPKAVQQEDSLGKQFYLRILREKTPRLYGLASIQEHSDKTFDKPSVLVSYRVIERDRDYDDDIRKKLNDTIVNTLSSNVKWATQQIKSMDARTTTKKSLTSVVENIVASPENVKKEEPKKEEAKKAEDKAEEVKKEDVKKEDGGAENIKKVEGDAENVKKEEVKKTDENDKNVQKADGSVENVKKEEVKKADSEAENVKKEEIQKKDGNDEKDKKAAGTAENIKKEDPKKQEVKKENGKKEDVKKAEGDKKAEEVPLTEEEKDKKRKEEISQLSNVLKEKIDEVVKEATFDIFTTLENFLDDPLKKVLVIQGDAGAGKTMLVRLFEQRLWKRHNNSLRRGVGAEGRLPLRIVLSEVRSLNKAVDDFLISHGCDHVGIRDIKKKPAVILFDGYDEINQSVNLYNLNNLAEWKDVKVIFTSRKENLTALKDEYIYSFTPGKDVAKVLSVIIQPINEDQIRTYFKSQATEDQQEALELEQKLKELKNGVEQYYAEGLIMKQVEYLENAAQSEEHQHLCELLHSLEEHLPEIEQILGEIDAMKIEGLELIKLAELFTKKIDLLGRMTDEEHLQKLATNLKEKAVSVHSIEEFMDLLVKTMQEGGPNERVLNLKQDYKNITNIQTLAMCVKDTPWFINYEYRKKDPFKEHTITAKLEEWLTKYEERCTPEYFAKSVETMRKDLQSCILFIEKLKSYKSLQAIENENLIITKNIDEYINSVEKYSQFEKANAFIKKIKEQLPEWKAAEKEIEELQKASDEEFTKSDGDQKGNYKETTRFKKLRENITKYEKFWKEFVEEVQQLDIFKDEIGYSTVQITDAFKELCDEETKKNLEAEHKEFESAFKSLETSISNFAEIRFSQNVYGWSKKVVLARRIFHDGYLEPTCKDLHKTLEEASQHTTDLYQFRHENKEGSSVITALNDQIQKLRELDNEKLTTSIQRLDEIAVELKTLDDQVKAMKPDVTEEALKISSLQKQIATLRRFSDATSVDPIIAKFKDITTSPFMLRMLVQTLVKYPRSSANKAELYRLFSNIHFEREKERVLKTEKVPPKLNLMDSFYDYSGDLAINMFFKKVTSIQFKNKGYKKQGHLKLDKKDIWSRFFDDTNTMIRLARRGAQITEDDGVVRFAHKSIMEYFAARQFYDDVVNYDPDEHDSYDPCLCVGYIIDNETAVYNFLRDICQSYTNKKKKDELTVFDKKLLEILDNSELQKLYGDNFEQNLFYPNIFLMLLLRENVQFKIGTMKEDSPTVKILDKIVRWMFDLSRSETGTGPKFAEMIERANKAGLMSHDVFQQILNIHYHLITKKPEESCCEDKFVTEKNKRENRVRLGLYPWSKNLVFKNGNFLDEVAQNEKGEAIETEDVWTWIISGKLYVYGSQDSIVVLKHATMDKCLAVSSDRQQETTLRILKSYFNIRDLVLNDVKSAWDAIESKWILRLNQYHKNEFTLVPLADSAKVLHGKFKGEEEYLTFFKGLCAYDVNSNNITDYVLSCQTCSPDKASQYMVCKNCVDICHKGHQVIVQKGGYGNCGCRFASKCKLAFSCTEKVSLKHKDDVKKYKCTECPADKRNRILCNGCKYHHEHDTGHKSFDELANGKCECDCLANKTRVIAETIKNVPDVYDDGNEGNEDEDENEN